MSKFKANIRIKTPEEIESMTLSFEKCSKGKSFNDATTYEKGKTKYIIVGTYTPKEGRDAGYFYCSKSNSQYELIDYGFHDGEKLLDKKGSVNQIKNTLKERKIAFLDVVKTAISRDDSSSDDDIVFYSLDYEAFRTVDFSGVKIAANSKNAEFRLTQILMKNGDEEIIRRIKLIPQNIRGNWKVAKDKKTLMSMWSEFFNK